MINCLWTALDHDQLAFELIRSSGVVEEEAAVASVASCRSHDRQMGFEELFEESGVSLSSTKVVMDLVCSYVGWYVMMSRCCLSMIVL